MKLFSIGLKGEQEWNKFIDWVREHVTAAKQELWFTDFRQDQI